jgi:hypothetical protein
MSEFGPQPPQRLPQQDMDVLALQMDQWSRARMGQLAWAERAREHTGTR